MAKPTTKTEVLKTILREINKQGLIYDGMDRVTKIYTAPLNAVAGDFCHIREFIYYTGTYVVKGRNEGYGLWLQAFDDAFLPTNHLLDNLGNVLDDNLGNQLTP